MTWNFLFKVGHGILGERNWDNEGFGVRLDIFLARSLALLAFSVNPGAGGNSPLVCSLCLPCLGFSGDFCLTKVWDLQARVVSPVVLREPCWRVDGGDVICRPLVTSQSVRGPASQLRLSQVLSSPLRFDEMGRLGGVRWMFFLVRESLWRAGLIKKSRTCWWSS